ncbi:anthranilate synthase component I family protein [Microbacterium sp. C7(2022)]|uniref:anthranilate synthase component I family protein n=1 Tax=Microbacterium sp. C7(2022) TaxID=2992759 RepID=UPI00237A3B4E|nr:anthranilate synthase component I family protein [Microbacterium sp. C7(2022)]MDE0547006.1 anthranilate synthase component I family protein [Microbacterium sp. C7(2022)]
MPPEISLVRWPGWVDPSHVHANLAADFPATFWLDAGPDATSGWSWVGVGEVEEDPADVGDVVCAGTAAAPPEGSPFRGGWIGWRGYDEAAAAAGAPAASDPLSDRSRESVPSELWMRARFFFAFDHSRREMWWAATGDDHAHGHRWTRAAHVHQDPPSSRGVHARHTAERYAELIGCCREAIARGDAYQLCLTTRFHVEDPRLDPLAVYERLRRVTPAHHGGLIRAQGVALASASPEQFLEISGGRVRTRPIKGTRPRSSDPAADAALARELQMSTKERAENVMIVDLMRNDLSRVSVAGSVRVEELLVVESYPAVHQLVSTVSGELNNGVTMRQIWDAAFPAGSMTGAPKLSAMTILHALEGGARGIFAGCFGWVSGDGRADLAMVIRTIVMHPDGAYVGAGGGITWRSDPAEEVAEVALKARGPLAALGAELPPSWAGTVG